jgi:hypothetical protein
MRKSFATYGRAGGPGQGLSRFEIQGDPTPSIPIWASGSLVTTSPAHMIGDDGSAHKYGTTIVGGNKNLINFGDVVYPLILGTTVVSGGNLQLGGGFVDARKDAAYQIVTWDETGTTGNPNADFDGEFVVRNTDATNYGASTEPYTTGGTITVVNGSATILGAGTTWTTNVLTGGYGYVPQKNKIHPGDLIGVGAAGARTWYRITEITNDTHLQVYPVYQGVGAGGLAYIIVRSGYGSYSRVVGIKGGGSVVFRYYCGNWLGGDNTPVVGEGMIECWSNAPGNPHFTSPQTTTPADFDAADVAYYKSFLVYGAGEAIGWSVAGFPTAFPFGATDFPAGNISVIAPDDDFVSFEFLGDQLIACFEASHWLVQATGIVPEFAFYKLPEPVGPITQLIHDPELGPNYFSATRPSCSGRASIFYMGSSQVMQLSGGVGKPISEPVKSWDALTPVNANTKLFTLSWDPNMDTVLIKSFGPVTTGACYQTDRGRWFPLDITPPEGDVFALTFGAQLIGATQERVGDPRVCWMDTTGFVHGIGNIPWMDTTGNTSYGWSWATPIIGLSEVYPTWKFGGFMVMARAALGAPIPTNLNWTIYGGSDPYHMNVRQGPIAYDYATGLVDSRNLLGTTLDDAYLGFVLSGTNWIELAGIRLFSSEAASRR